MPTSCSTKLWRDTCGCLFPLVIVIMIYMMDMPFQHAQIAMIGQSQAANEKGNSNYSQHSKHLCSTSNYKTYGRIYNCSALKPRQQNHQSKSTGLKIAVVSADIDGSQPLHFWTTEKDDIRLENNSMFWENGGNGTFRRANHIFSNRIDYILEHSYVYFEFRDVAFDAFDDGLETIHAKIALQKPFILDVILRDFAEKIDYLLWIDRDVIIYNCSTRIESIIERSQSFYHFDADLILGLPGVLQGNINDGVVLYKNSDWTQHFLAQWMLVSTHPKQFNFFNVGCAGIWDNCIFNTLIMGFDPFNTTDENEMSRLVDAFDNGKVQRHDFQHGNEEQIKEQSIYIHEQSIHPSIRNNVGVLMTFYINFFGPFFFNRPDDFFWPYDAFVVHFAGGTKHLMQRAPFKDYACPTQHA